MVALGSEVCNSAAHALRAWALIALMITVEGGALKISTRRMALLFALLLALSISLGSSQEYPFRNTSLPYDERVNVRLFMLQACRSASCTLSFVGPGGETDSA